jgi:pimeloyl-ACP methyl ester carboxylesterase
MDLEQWRSLARPMDFRGHRVMVYRGGNPDGSPLLLIHGFPTAAWDWHRVWGVLGREHRLIAPDLLGFGYSDKPLNFPYSFRLQADLCEQALRETGAKTYRILAHDYGDTVAQELLARRIEVGPDHGLESVCLLNGGIFPELQRPRPIQKLLAGPLGPPMVRVLSKDRAMASLAAVFGPDTQPKADEQDAFWDLIDFNDGRRVMPGLLQYLKERRRNRDRWVDALAGSPVPLMFIDGLLDPVSGAGMAEGWRRMVPQGELVELAGIGHYPQIEDPEAVLEACLPFLAR